MLNGTIAENPFFINIYLIYRSIYLTFEKDVGIKGIPAYRFSPPPEVLASPEINPANTGFCVPAGTCMGTGVLKVSVCRKGIFITFVLFTLHKTVSGYKMTYIAVTQFRMKFV